LIIKAQDRGIVAQEQARIRCLLSGHDTLIVRLPIKCRWSDLGVLVFCLILLLS